MKQRQAGFHVIGLVIILLVLSSIGLIGYKVLAGGREQTSTQSSQGGQNTQSRQAAQQSGWVYSQQKLAWEKLGAAAPTCKEPLVFDSSPVAMESVTAVGLPGSYRGYDYKAHGGFRLADSTNGQAEIRLPMDANFKGITRYYESVPGQADELQYLVDFENECGIAIRFDHLSVLAPAFQTLAEKSPAPKKNDTSNATQPATKGQPFKAGEVIATAVGFASTRNYGFDFGVYDYRSRNKISENKQWAAIHQQFSATTFHGVCWLPMLPGEDAAKAESIAKDRNNYDTRKAFNLTSDYCDFAPHRTLEFNGGKPTDG